MPAGGFTFETLCGLDIHQPPLEIRGPSGWGLSTFAQGQTFSLMVADVDSDQPDTYSLSLI